jgi:hypothetical protein
VYVQCDEGEREPENPAGFETLSDIKMEGISGENPRTLHNSLHLGSRFCTQKTNTKALNKKGDPQENPDN